MSDETVAYGILTGYAPLAAIIQDKVYYVIAAQSAVAPYIVYNLLGAAPESYLSEVGGIDHRTIQVSGFAATATVAKSVIEQSRKAMEALNYVCIAEGFSGYEDDTQLYHFVADFSLWLHR